MPPEPRSSPRPRRALALLAAAVVTGTLAVPAAAAPGGPPGSAGGPAEGSEAAPARAARTQAAEPRVVAHRGASGYRPEHTLPAYRLALRMGADALETDVVATRDGALVVRHENELSMSTDVAGRPRFAGRRDTRVIDGKEYTGWFAEDFTLAELRTLRAREPMPDARPGSARYDGRYRIPTFADVLELVADHHRREQGSVRLLVELKHPAYFRSLGLPLEGRVLKALARHRLGRPGSPVLLQAFEPSSLRRLDPRTPLRLVQLVRVTGSPWDGSGTSFREMVTPAGLRAVAAYAAVVCVEKPMVLPWSGPADPDGIVPAGHAAGLRVEVWTVRDENMFLAPAYRRGSDLEAHGDVAGEVAALLDAGVDGFLADHVDTAVAARDAWLRRAHSSGTRIHAAT